MSGKARKQQLQTKRAVKKASVTPVPFPADVVANHPALAALLGSTAPSTSASTSSNPAKSHHARSGGDRIGHRFRTAEQRERDEVHGARMALESRFVRLPKHIQEVHAHVAASERLVRPVDADMGVLRPEDLVPRPQDVAAGEGEQAGSSNGAAGSSSNGAATSPSSELTCPKRPKWSYNQTKREVEKNEGASSPFSSTSLRSALTLPARSRAEGIFRTWLASMDDILARAAAPPLHEDGTIAGLPGSPTFFERNLNVWRQLWRTTEVSDILLVLIGASSSPFLSSSKRLC